MNRETLLHITIIDLFLTAELKNNPGLCGRPLIIGGEGEEKGLIKKGLVLAASAEALALGLRPGMSMRKALKAAPTITALVPRYEVIETLSEKFFALLRGSCPIVESFGLSEAFISINRLEPAPDGDGSAYAAASKLASELQGRLIKDMGLHTAVGIAPNKPLARLASQRAEKDGIAAVTKNEASAFIKTEPISSMPEMDKDAKRLLKAINMGTVDELSKTPLLFFEKNFGKVMGKVFFESARGRGPVEVMPFFEPTGISDELTFDEGISDASIIKESLYVLTDGLTLRLKAVKRDCSAISIKVTFSDFECIVKTLTLEEGTDSFIDTWAGALRLLEDTPLPKKVILIGLKLHGQVKKT